jgi:glycerol-3-phosphate acyltransferase PlsY
VSLAGLGVLAVAAGFAIGSIPFGVIVARAFYRRDIRAEGSGNIGAANALRTLGKKGAAGVLVLDALKGAIPVAVLTHIGAPTAIAALGGAAAVLGHCYSPLLGGRGGKGVATSYGAIWALSWPAGVAFTLIWVATIVAVGYASVASMLASVLMPFALWFMLGRAGLIYGVASALLIVFKHRGNLARLRAGTENPLSFGRTRTTPADSAGRRAAPQTGRKAR